MLLAFSNNGQFALVHHSPLVVWSPSGSPNDVRRGSATIHSIGAGWPGIPSLSFPVQMTSWPKPDAILVGCQDQATPLGILKDGLRLETPLPELMARCQPIRISFWITGGNWARCRPLVLLLGLAMMLESRNLAYSGLMILTVFIA